MQHIFDRLDARLPDRETVAGSGFGIVAITAVVAVDVARVLRVRPGEQHVHLRRWPEAMGRRPSTANRGRDRPGGRSLPVRLSSGRSARAAGRQGQFVEPRSASIDIGCTDDDRHPHSVTTDAPSRAPAARRFRLTRYFALTSLGGIVVVTVGLIWLFSELMLYHLVEQNTRSNAALAELFARRMLVEHDEYLLDAVGRSGDQLRADPRLKRLDRMVRGEMHGLPVVKVKLYATDGVTAYSTDPAQIGERKGKNDGVLRALAGTVSGGYTHRDRFDAFDGVIADRDFVFTYVPVRRGDGSRVDAVLEIYADVTESRAQDKDAQWQVIGLVLGLLGLLYACLAAIVHRADRVITRQDREADEREATIRHQAHHDALTALPNRVRFAQRMQQVVSLASRDRRRFALMYIDLDGFKRVNDSLGHPAGDQLLKVTAARIHQTLRRTDLLFRMGGDEFTVILTELVSDDDAGEMAQRIIQAVSAPVTLGDRSVGVGASVGIAIYPGDGLDQDELLRNADFAMYRAKQAGGLRHANCAQAMHAAGAATEPRRDVAPQVAARVA